MIFINYAIRNEKLSIADMDFMTRMTRNLQKGKAMITLDKVKIELQRQMNIFIEYIPAAWIITS